MNDLQRKLHIFYRHVHVKAEQRSRDPNKSRPAWFSHEKCFRNLMDTIESDPMGKYVTVTVMYDGTVDDLSTDFITPYLTNQRPGVRLQLIQAGADMASFLITMSYAKGADDRPSDLLYFLENDYVHQQGWVSKVFELYDSGIAFDVVSLYDHKDKYILPMYAGLTARLLVTSSHHWRTAPSTCGSFIISKSALDRDFDAYASGKPDFHLFTEVVAARHRTLLTPIPGLSTHAMEGYTSPNVDWARLAGERPTSP